MGTRHLTCVVMDGDFKVAQYGQWDGYLSGQGQTIADFLADADLDLFREKLKGVSFLDREGVLKKWVECGGRPDGSAPNNAMAEKFYSKYPHLSRDAGADVLDMIYNGLATELEDERDFAGDSLFCEFAYVVDLDANQLEVYRGFNTKPIDPSERFAKAPVRKKGDFESNEYSPIKLWAKVPLKNIKQGFEELLAKDAKEAEEEE